MQDLVAPKQMKGGQQPGQTEKMIPVQVADQDMIDLLKTNFQSSHLNLGSFGTINQEILMTVIQYLGTEKTLTGRSGRTAAKDGEFE